MDEELIDEETAGELLLSLQKEFLCAKEISQYQEKLLDGLIEILSPNKSSELGTFKDFFIDIIELYESTWNRISKKINIIEKLLYSH